MATKAKGSGSSFRSAITGRFVTEKTATRHPKTTVKERRPKGKK